MSVSVCTVCGCLVTDISELCDDHFSSIMEESESSEDESQERHFIKEKDARFQGLQLSMM